MIRAACLFLSGLICAGTAAGQDNAKAFDEAGLSKQQQIDVLHVTGDQSGDAEIPGKPFIEIVRLSIDTTKRGQIVVWRGTGGMGNKDIWIFQQTGDHAVLILQNAGGSMYATLDPVHHGMHDFITFWNMGGGTGGNEVFQFDGVRYRSAYCYETLSLGSDTEPEKDGPHHPCKRN